MIGLILPNGSYHAAASLKSPVELETKNETNELVVGDTIELKIKKSEGKLQETRIALPENLTVTKNKVVLPESVTIDFNEETNDLMIDWKENEQEAEITMELEVEKPGDGEVYADSFTEPEAETVKSNTISFSVLRNESTEESQSEADNSSEESSAAKQEEVKSQAKTGTQEKDEESNAKSSTSSENTISTYSTTKSTGETRNVTTWDGFVEALENSAVYRIEVTDTNTNADPGETSIKASADDSQLITVSGDKLIIGIDNPYPTIHFEESQVNIGANKVTVQGITLMANQNDGNDEDSANITEPSMFYSTSSLAELHLHDASNPYTANGQTVTGITPQNGQVAYLNKGHVYISGNSYIKTHAPREVFEASKITFEEGANFIGYNEPDDDSIDGEDSAEVINLHKYNPTITIEKNAAVTLGTYGEKSVIKMIEDMGEPAVNINVQEGATFTVRAESVDVGDASALIDLSNNDSHITLAQGATFDIQNHRNGNYDDGDLGGLFYFGGTVGMDNTMGGTESQFEIWDGEAENVNEAYGPKYTRFDRVLNGKLHTSGKGGEEGTIVSGEATDGSSLAFSANEDYSGRSFSEVFNQRDTSKIKRIKISGPQKITAPEIDTVNDQSIEIKGQVTSEVADSDYIEIKNSNGPAILSGAINDDGTFTIPLGDTKLTAGTTYYAVVVNANANDIEKSERASFTAEGTLSLTEVPVVRFGPTPIPSKTKRISRNDSSENSITVRDTRLDSSSWSLTATAEPLTTEKENSLNRDALIFVDGEEADPLVDGATIIEAGPHEEDSTTWGDEEGILLEIDPTRSTILSNETYSTEITWTLQDAP